MQIFSINKDSLSDITPLIAINYLKF